MSEVFDIRAHVFVRCKTCISCSVSDDTRRQWVGRMCKDTGRSVNSYD